MNTFKQIGKMLLLAIIYSQMAFAVSPSPSSNDTSQRTSNHPFTPSTSEENAFIQNSQNRMNRLNEQNRKMIEDDRKMMREGYDPNEIDPQPHAPLNDQSQHPHWDLPNGQMVN